MWLFYGLVHSFLIAFVNFTDEHLATNNKLPSNATVHTKVGSVLLISTLMSFVGACIVYLLSDSISLSPIAFKLAIFSGLPLVAMYASYFYLLQLYPVHQIAPLFQISSIWLLLIELIFGGSITLLGMFGILVLIYGAYVLDAGTFKWKIPTKLLRFAVPATSTWAIALFMVRIASENDSPVAIAFWQLITIGVIGILLFLFVEAYREGFMYRIKNQGKLFLGLSFANETFAEMGYLFSNLAVSIAPVAAYVSALSGVQSLFVLLLFLIFPQGKRANVTKMQWIAVILISVGVVMIEQS